MKKIIIEKLKEIETAEQVRVLYAAESGSRAWGFASPDSDYDVRFIYAREPEAYFSILPKRDVIEWQLDETLDISGWDIQKMFRLLLKSNPTLFEWASSPVVYQTTDDWERLRPVLNDAFSSKAGMHHYLSMAHGNYREYLKGETVRIKKYLYVLRPILACEWILDWGTPPPMLFRELVDAELETSVWPLVDELLALKQTRSEIDVMPRIDPLNRYIEMELEKLAEAIRQMPAQNGGDPEALDVLFRRIVLGGTH